MNHTGICTEHNKPLCETCGLCPTEPQHKRTCITTTNVNAHARTTTLAEQLHRKLCFAHDCDRLGLHLCDHGDCLNKFCNEQAHGERCPNCNGWICAPCWEGHLATCALPDHVALYPSERERFGNA